MNILQVKKYCLRLNSPLGKTFEKKKTIEDQGQKRFHALKTLKLIKNDKSDDNEWLLKYKEIFDELSTERISEIYSISKQLSFNTLTYQFKDKDISSINCVEFRGPMHFLFNIVNNGNASIEKMEDGKKQFNQI